jgi:hypothetical protein
MEEIYFNDAIKDRFITRNKANINRLDNFIDNCKIDIQLIITSPVMFEYLKILEGSEFDEFNELLKYRGKRVITDSYLKTDQVNFVMKNNKIDFNLPCVCGIYKDEKHP